MYLTRRAQLQLAWIIFVLSVSFSQALSRPGRIFLVDLSRRKFISNKRVERTTLSAGRDMEIYSIWQRWAIFLTPQSGEVQCSQAAMASKFPFLSIRPFYIFLVPFLCLGKKVSGYAPLL
jgi:hypothetical protein